MPRTNSVGATPRLHSVDGPKGEMATGPHGETKPMLSRSRSDLPQGLYLQQGRVALDQRCREVNELLAQVREARRRTDLALQRPSCSREEPRIQQREPDCVDWETAKAPYVQAYRKTSVRASGGVDFRCSAARSKEDMQPRYPLWGHLRAPCLIFNVREVTSNAPHLYNPISGVVST
mmetsp:Transcript_76148/g.150592  ORF Transcript_76148/g.150592 Transcript_76148/m.150592 type:complete len:177 (+) Transcript_76148:143-673(+)